MKTKRMVLHCGLVLMLAMMVCWAGCSKSRALPTKLEGSLEYEEKVIAKGFALERYLRVARHKSERISGDLLQIKLGLENVKSGHGDDLWCDIQVVFYDKDGFELEKTNWAPLFLSAGQITFYKTSSLSSRAHDYTIFLRNPRKSDLK